MEMTISIVLIGTSSGVEKCFTFFGSSHDLKAVRTFEREVDNYFQTVIVDGKLYDDLTSVEQCRNHFIRGKALKDHSFVNDDDNGFYIKVHTNIQGEIEMRF